MEHFAPSVLIEMDVIVNDLEPAESSPGSNEEETSVSSISVVPPLVASIEAPPPRAGSSTLLWLLWSEIAATHCHLARSHRAAALTYRRDLTDEGQRFSDALWQETKHAMLAITASAMAINGFYGSTSQFISIPAATVASWNANRTKRSSVILETFKQGFKLQAKPTMWQGELEWLFDVRDAAAHSKEQLQDTVLHPTGVGTASEYSTYCLESAERATILLLDLLQTCQENPKPKYPDLVKYVAKLEPSMDKISDLFRSKP